MFYQLLVYFTVSVQWDRLLPSHQRPCAVANGPEVRRPGVEFWLHPTQLRLEFTQPRCPHPLNGQGSGRHVGLPWGLNEMMPLAPPALPTTQQALHKQ